MIYQGKIAGVSLSTEYREGDRDWALYEKHYGRQGIEKVFQKMIKLIEEDINLVRHRKTSLEWDEESYHRDCFEVGPDLSQDIWSELQDGILIHGWKRNLKWRLNTSNGFRFLRMVESLI